MIQVDHAHYETVDRALINPNADEGAKALYQYLLESYGKRVISVRSVRMLYAIAPESSGSRWNTVRQFRML